MEADASRSRPIHKLPGNREEVISAPGGGEPFDPIDPGPMEHVVLREGKNGLPSRIGLVIDPQRRFRLAKGRQREQPCPDRGLHLENVGQSWRCWRKVSWNIESR